MGTIKEERGSFGEALAIHFEHSTSDEQKLRNGTLINHQITWYVTTPLSVVGLVLNFLVLSVWRTKKTYQPIVFLFKVLATLDITYLAMFNLWWYSPAGSIYSYVMSGIYFAGQYMLVNITLLIAVWRWITVFLVEKSPKLLTRYRVRLAVGIVLTYCAVILIVEHTVSFYLSDRNASVLSTVVSNLLLSAPILILTGLMISLASVLQPTRVVADLSSTGHLHFHSRSRHTLAKVRRLTYAILSLTVTAFVIYPLFGVVTAYYRLTSSPEHAFAKTIAFAVANLLYIINSSVPFFYYFVFIYKFRKLCLLKFITSYTGNYSTKAFSDSDQQTSRMPSEMLEGPGHSTANPSSYRHSLVFINGDGTLTISKAPMRSSLREDSREFRAAFSNRASIQGHKSTH